MPGISIAEGLYGLVEQATQLEQAIAEGRNSMNPLQRGYYEEALAAITALVRSVRASVVSGDFDAAAGIITVQVHGGLAPLALAVAPRRGMVMQVLQESLDQTGPLRTISATRHMSPAEAFLSGKIWEGIASAAGSNVDGSVLASVIEIYLDTEDLEQFYTTVDEVFRLAGELGYQPPILDSIERGSFFARAWTSLKNSMSSEELDDKVKMAQRAVELRAVDELQARVDLDVTAAMRNVIDSVSDIPNACIRVGSLVMLKYIQNGEETLVARQLNQRELRAVSQHPELQKDPSQFLVALADMLDVMDLPELASESEASSET